MEGMSMLLHLLAISLIVLGLLKYSAWVSMLVTFSLSMVFFSWIVSQSPPHGLNMIVFILWPPVYTLFSGAIWLLFRKLRSLLK